MLCRTENRIGQLAQAEPGEQSTEARALDGKLGGRPSGVVARSALRRFRGRGNMRDWSLSHATPFLRGLAVFGGVARSRFMLPDRDSIMTPRIHGAWPGSTPVEIWISKPLSYTMLPTHARGRPSPPPGACPLLGDHNVAASFHHNFRGPDVARQHPKCGAAPAIHSSIAPIAAAKCILRMTLVISSRPARLLRSNSLPTTPPSLHSGFPHGESR
jgi:hypothetical protein